MSTEKIDHSLTEDRASGNGAPLSRQMTVALTPEQYERLFFQPEGPRRGDLSKRFGNPTLLGLICFLIPYTSTIFTLCGLRGAVAPTSLIGLDGDYYMIGFVGMILAGIAEFILGNSFPMSVFVVYGCHWGSLAYAQDPFYNQVSAFAKVGSSLGAEWNASQGFHNVVMVLVSFTFLIATIRVNIFFVATFFGLTMMFAFIAAADFYVPHITAATEVSGLHHVSTLLKIGGGFGWLGLISGWYLSIVTACATVDEILRTFLADAKTIPVNSAALAEFLNATYSRARSKCCNYISASKLVTSDKTIELFTCIQAIAIASGQVTITSNRTTCSCKISSANNTKTRVDSAAGKILASYSDTNTEVCQFEEEQDLFAVPRYEKSEWQ
ncbi:hypothetical protein KCV04_g8770, partial [Aureobasidium melanogenum]